MPLPSESLGGISSRLTLALAAVSPAPVQTQSRSVPLDSFMRGRILSDAAPPDITPSPLQVLHKRVKEDHRVSYSFGACVLRSGITFGDYYNWQDFSNPPARNPTASAASSYFLVTVSNDILSTSTDAQGMEHTHTTCVAPYIYSTNDYVSSGPPRPLYRFPNPSD